MITFIGEVRLSRRLVQWKCVREMPHMNGDPAYLYAVSHLGRERTFHYAEWLALKQCNVWVAESQPEEEE